jgi:hypothetical protein
MKKKEVQEQQLYLGTIDRDGYLYIPWLGSCWRNRKHYGVGQILIVTMENNKVVGVELPEFKQLKAMKDETTSQWLMFDEIFKQSPLFRQTLMLKALNEVMKENQP